MLIVLSLLPSCNNSGNVKVPENINANITTAPVTGEVVVKHIISLELPTVFTDTCKAKYNDRDYPNAEERAIGYNKCVADYINELVRILGSITPPQLPVPTL